MSDQPVTPDREALKEALRDAGLFATIHDNVWACDDQNFGATMRPIYDAAVDALLPLLTDALDRARQQGRDEAAEVLESAAGSWGRINDWDGENTQAVLEYAAALARGGPNRKDEE